MYAALWRRIPGGLPGKIAGMVGLAFGVLALLFFVVFPVVERNLPWNEVTVDHPTVSTPAPTAAPTVAPSGLP